MSYASDKHDADQCYAELLADQGGHAADCDSRSPHSACSCAVGRTEAPAVRYDAVQRPIRVSHLTLTDFGIELVLDRSGR